MSNEMMMVEEETKALPMLHIIHHTDMDGHCSAAIAAKYYTESRVDELGNEQGKLFTPEQVMFHNTTYNHVDNGVGNVKEGDTVVIVDFSLRPEDMAAVVEKAADVIWIDHHANKLEDFAEVKGVRDVNEAACILAWKYFYGDAPMPNVVQAVGDYDMWRHDNPEVVTMNEGFSLVESEPSKNMDMWLILLHKPTSSEEAEAVNDMIMQIMQMGYIIQAYQKDQDEIALRHKFTVTIDGLKWLCCNARFKDSSNMDVDVADDIDVLCWFYYEDRKDGSFGWKHSLRTPSAKDKAGVGADVSEIARKYEGGGRRNTAGFTTRTPLVWDVREAERNAA